jgi:putative transposase
VGGRGLGELSITLRVPPVPRVRGPGMEDTLITASGLTFGVSSRCMKGKRIRYQQTGEFHFLTFSCYLRRPYLEAVTAKKLFEDALERVRRRYFLVVAGYVVMPEHVHLLVNEPKGALLSKAVKALKLSVSMRSRERPFWQAHYYDFNVSSHGKFVEKLRYIHRNPAKRGLVQKPEDWAWSSFRHYQTGMRGTVEIESEWTARERGWQLPDWMRYRPLDSTSPVPECEGPGAPKT